MTHLHKVHLHTSICGFPHIHTAVNAGCILLDINKSNNLVIVVHLNPRKLLRMSIRKLLKCGFPNTNLFLIRKEHYSSNVKLAFQASLNKLYDGDSKFLRLTINEKKIFIITSNSSIKSIWYSLAASIFKSLASCLKCFLSGNIKSIFNLKYASISVGLHLASHFLRSYSGVTRLRFTPSLYRSFVETYLYCIIYNESLKYFSLKQRTFGYVLSHDCFYPVGLLTKLAQNYGLCAVSNSAENSDLILLETKDTNELIVDPKYSFKSSRYRPCELSLNVDSVKRYLERRVSNITALPYMQFALPQSEVIPEVSQISLQSMQEKIKFNVFIFLHAFTDAQYAYGFDGYKCLMDWTISTITALSNNPKILNIYLKFHPNTPNHKSVIHTKRYIERICLADKRVLISPASLVVKDLLQIHNSVCITHHGSVSEEACYLGIPVISSSFSACANFQPYCYTWSDKIVYEHFLREMDYDSVKTFLDKSRLYDFIMHRYFSFPNIVYRDVEFIWAYHEHQINVSRLSSLELPMLHETMSFEIKNLDPDSFQRFIEITTNYKLLFEYYMSLH